VNITIPDYNIQKHLNMASLADNSNLMCPITLVLMIDPVITPDGYTYERAAIEQAIRANGKSPITRQPMRIDQLVPNRAIRDLIENLSTPAQDHVANTPDVVKAVVRSRGTLTQLTLGSPDGEAQPLHVCFVLDNSGSMQIEGQGGVESDGFSVLQVVKQGILTCLTGFRPQDKASLVVYSTDARVVVPLSTMDTAGKARFKVAMAGVEPENSTNIWAGLELGLKQLPHGGTVFLLTDGQPNHRPPRGELAMLQSACDGRNDIVVNTYGFGYNLDSKLLVELARATQGSYSFIPDIGLVGTVFIHAMANLRTSVTQKLTVCIETEGIINLPEVVKANWGYVLPIGRITKGQPRDLFFACDQPVSITVEQVAIEMSEEEPDVPDRQVAAMGIFQCHGMARIDSCQSNTALNSLMATVTPEPLLDDLNGQVREAVVASAYRKWGRHYLPSLALAHWTQQCNNFLDKGIQEYGGPTFQITRDALEKAFNALPAPKPVHRDAVVYRMRSSGRRVTAAPERMTSYNSASAPCAAGPCRVKMSDGTRKACQHITKGDMVETSTGDARVVCVLKTPCEVVELVKYGRLLVTPYHPVKVVGQWTHPCTLGIVEEYPCDAVYSFLLEQGFVDMFVEDVPFITLAHGIENDEVATHSFYGTQQVVDAMRDNFGFSEGLVEVQGVQRDENGLVYGFEF